MTLTDRYVAAVVAHVPAAQRTDIEAELRASIADAIDAQPEPASADSERTVLQELGDPELLAATYAERSLYLIGPKLFLTWKRLVVLLLWIVVPIVGALNILSGLLDGDDFWPIVGTTLGAMWGTAILILFVVTLVFAVMERSDDPADLPSEWTLDSLGDAPQPNVTWGDTIASALTLVITAALIVWQQVAPWTHNAAGEGLPVINPELWSFVLPALLVVMGIELVTVIVRQVRGHWTMRDWVICLALNVAVLALVLPPLLQHTFLNRELFTELGWPDAASPITLGQLELIIAGVIVITALTDVIPAWRKASAAVQAN